MNRCSFPFRTRCAGFILLFAWLCLPAEGVAQVWPEGLPRKPEAEAIRVEFGSIEIDGKLDDAGWEAIAPETRFRELRPVPFAMPKQETEVRFAYDDRALYVGARMWDTAPDSILHQLIQRDGDGNTDVFGIWFNCFDDGVNGVRFSVTPDGVQSDELLSNDDADGSWNAVWQAECRIDDRGWVAEFALPWSVFRFNDSGDAPQNWGMNFYRYIRRYRSDYVWRAMDPNQEGLMNQGGLLTGIQGITPPPRFSLYPYASAYLDTEGSESVTRLNGGLDMKVGIGDAFTFDMTLVPDFGQVVADNLVLNLSPYEVRFNENRQFFTEGTELFNKTGTFYSRRVGDREQLLNASKVTGRTQGGTGLGLLNAVSRDGNGSLTDFSVAVVDQNLPNNGYVSVQSGQVLRGDGRADDWVGSAAFQVRDSLQRWSLKGQGGLNRHSESVDGSGEGHTWGMELSRLKGRLRWSVGHYVESPEYDPNAVGFLRAPNAVAEYANIEYRIQSPFEVLGLGFNRMSWELEVNREMLHTPRSFVSQTYDLEWRLFLASFDFIKFGATAMPYDGRDYFAPRLEDRFWRVPKWWSWDAFMSTDYRREFAIDIGTWNAGGVLYPDWKERNFRLEPIWRPNDHFRISHVYSHQDKFNERGWSSLVDSLPNGTALDATRSLWAKRNNYSRTHVLNASYVLDNRKGITFRLRHYWSRVENGSFYWLEDDGLLGPTDEITLTDEGTSPYDISYNAWSIDCVFRWIFAPGSELSIVWKNLLESQGDLLPATYADNLEDVLRVPHRNSFSFKAIYFLDYADLTGRR